ncbi:MAG: Flp pilus assembly complex ATPase component TadA [Sandaracinaceae bacterium]|nr:Flp pilus assembly complex ATPase component TadA [Sandaracinaceae bacterium]
MSESAERYVGEILVRRGALPAGRLDDLLRSVTEKNVRLLELLEATREVQPEQVTKALAEEVGIPFVDQIKHGDVPAQMIDTVPITFARQHKLLALGYLDPSRPDTGPVRVAVSNPLDPTPLDDLRALLGRPILPVAATSEAIEDAINRVYERKDETALTEGKEEAVSEELQDLIDMTDEAPVIRWVNNLFYTAAQRRASDIHIEPSDKEVVVRYRIDGNLQVAKTAHKGFLNSIVSRVKIEAGLNIAEKRLPQDGRITKRIQGRLIDVRVSTIPTSKGESIVMRLLDKEKVLLDLEDLGYSGAPLACIHHLVTRPNGILLVTGPTGSGKTTTLYAALSKINTPDLKILTAEDPVEYELRGIGQLHVQPKIGLTFASALRAFLRQDPDVIMVGEIRDHETAEIAIHASLTGHLVLSTLHTNDAAGAITRMVEMEVEHYLITSSLLGAIAQRLVRRLCPRCKQPYQPTDQDFRQLGVDRARLKQILAHPGTQPWPGMPHEYEIAAAQVSAAADPSAPDASFPDLSDELEPVEAEPTQIRDFRDLAPPRLGPSAAHATGPAWGARGASIEPGTIFYRGVGCEECGGTGYRGRIAIAEILILDDAVRREVLNRSDANQIARVAIARGMRTLREDGARVVAHGMTSLEEVLAATQAGEVD